MVVCVDVLTFFGSEYALYRTSVALSEQITSPAQLRTMLQEEKEWLGIPEKRIYARFGYSPQGIAHAKKLGQDSYEIVLDSGRNRAVFKHELYHIYDGHVEDITNCSSDVEAYFKNFLIYDTQAILYQSLGIRL